ncbi:MAG: sigma-54 dependent transcriptional regulator [Bryobacteraceae bacterium]|nr:sigma-54 dependent transcriptional regulator [Bryobacteraceae bacterium]
MQRRRILVVDDDESVRRITQFQLEEIGYHVMTASHAQQALAIVESWTPALVLTDLKMPGISGLDLLKQIRAAFPEVTVVLMTAFGTISNAVEAMKAGAWDYITKPINFQELGMLATRAFERQTLLDEVRTLRTALDEKFGFENIIGHSRVLMPVLNLASRAAQTDTTVLIHGETGTGKELLAHAIHHNSRRRQGAFVTVNCGAIARDLIESELFGHVKGAFTGAVANKRGKAEAADGGTLFLDEIGELPLDLQVKLLRLIQQGEIAKVGATGTSTVDVRIIAATHRNLLAMSEDGAFRQDLYYRLAVIPLDIPPLRDRPEDIPELIDHLFAKARKKHARPNLKLPASVVSCFVNHRWPGNVRELENVVERLVVLSSEDEITVSDLPEVLRKSRNATEAIHLQLPATGISLEAIERELIERALKKFHGNQTHAARYLDVSRRTLIYRMEKHGIREVPDADAAVAGD